MTQETEAPEEHSLEATAEVAETIRDLIESDDEGELEPYKTVIKQGNRASFKVTNADNDLEYLVTIDPIEED